MPAEAAAHGGRAASIAPTIHPTGPWRVQEVTALPDNRLLVRFVDGLTGIVDLSALIASPRAGVFARLRDRTVFEQVRVKMGAVVWPGELDLAPDAMRTGDRHAYIEALQRARAGRGTAAFERLLYERLDSTLAEYVSASREALPTPKTPISRRDGDKPAP